MNIRPSWNDFLQNLLHISLNSAGILTFRNGKIKLQSFLHLVIIFRNELHVSLNKNQHSFECKMERLIEYKTFF